MSNDCFLLPNESWMQAEYISDTQSHNISAAAHAWLQEIQCRTHILQICFTRDMTHSHVTRLIHVSRVSFTWDMTHPHVTYCIHAWHDSFIYDMSHVMFLTGLIAIWHNSFTCDITHPYIAWLIHIWHGRASTPAHINESCHVWMRHVMSNINESCPTWKIHVTHGWVISYMNAGGVHQHISMSHVTYEWGMSHMIESCPVWMSHVTYECRGSTPAT